MVAKVKLHSFYIDYLSCYILLRPLEGSDDLLLDDNVFLAYAPTSFEKREQSPIQWLWNGLVMIPSTSILLFVGKQFYHATCCYSLDSFSDSCGRQLPATTTYKRTISKIGVRFWRLELRSGTCSRSSVQCTAVDFANSTGLVVY